jgi:hypothetical protein
MGAAFDAIVGSQPYTTAAGLALIFSFVGIAGGVLEDRRILGAVITIVGAVGVLVSIGFLSALTLASFLAGVTPLEVPVSVSLLGVLAFVLFLAGGLLILTQQKELQRSRLQGNAG